MVIGSSGVVSRWHGGIGILVLVAACGGQSISRTRDEGGSGVSNGGVGGTRTGSGGLAGGAGGPSLSMLDDLCDNICTATADAKCDGFELNQCLSSCYVFNAAAEQTAQCANKIYAFLTCVNAMPITCQASDQTVCNVDDVIACVVAYCKEHPDSRECSAVGGQN